MVAGLAKRRYRRRIVIQIFVAVVIFLSGIVAGSGGTVALLKNKGILRPPRSPRPPRMMASEIAHEIGSKYDLTTDQVAQVEQIFEKAGKSLEVLRQDFGKKMEASRQEVLEGLKYVLPPEKFEQWKKDFNARHGRRSGPTPREGGRRGSGSGKDRDSEKGTLATSQPQ